MMFPDERRGQVKHEQDDGHGIQRDLASACVKGFAADVAKHNKESQSQHKRFDYVRGDAGCGEGDKL